MRHSFAAVLTVLFLTGGASAQVRIVAPNVSPPQIEPNYGESQTGNFANWQERVMLELTNRARSAPATEMTACGANCAEGACYSAMTPFVWTLNLNKSSRFHSDEMGRQAYFGHDSTCTVPSNISTIYPASCDGSASCACAGVTATVWSSRIGLFGPPAPTPFGENIAAGSTLPYDIFYGILPATASNYGWLTEPTTNTACGFHANDDNGHRWSILAQTSNSLGNGYDDIVGSPWGQYWTQDFANVSGVSAQKIPSGAHWTSIGHARDPSGGDTTVEFWANWFDSAGPTAATLVLDGSSYAMSLPANRGTAANGAWTVSIPGISGATCHLYHFAFTSASTGAVRYPDTGELSFGNGTCADWTANSCIAPAITSQPAGTTVNEGTPVTLSVTATGTAPAYQWYIGSSGTTTNPIAAATASSIVVTPNATTSYWVQVTTACGTANSSTATVTVNPVSPGAAAGLYLVTPCRLIDTRNAVGPFGGPALNPGAVRNVVATGACGVPAGATSLALNVTVVAPGAGGWLTLYPGPAGSALPSNSTLNYKTGNTRANDAVIRLGFDGSLNVYNSGPATVNFIIDISGYFK